MTTGRAIVAPPATSADYAGVIGRGIHRPGAPSQWTRANAAWLAAVLDCEGCVSGRAFTHNAGGTSFVAWMRVGMMDRQVVDRIYEITGVGRIFHDKRGVWNWNAASQAARYVLERIWPWLVIKQNRALAAIELCRHVEERAARRGRTLSPQDLAYRSMIVTAIRDWNGHPPRPNSYEPPAPPLVELPDYLPVGNRTSDLGELARARGLPKPSPLDEQQVTLFDVPDEAIA